MRPGIVKAKVAAAVIEEHRVTPRRPVELGDRDFPFAAIPHRSDAARWRPNRRSDASR